MSGLDHAPMQGNATHVDMVFAFINPGCAYRRRPPFDRAVAGSARNHMFCMTLKHVVCLIPKKHARAIVEDDERVAYPDGERR
jgi:hypothetical protein